MSERFGRRMPDGDWPEDMGKDVGGEHCNDCGCVFIGAEGRSRCKQCAGGDEAKTIAMCRGCEDDFYNDKNPLGVKRCWNFESATIIERSPVGIWDSPPYVWKPQQILSCRRVKGIAYLKREDSRMCESIAERNALAEKWRRESSQSSDDQGALK